MALSDLAHELREPAGDPEGALVLLHGRGVDERDLFPLLEALDPERRLVGITPRAPHQLTGQPGHHWYIVEQVGFPHGDTFKRAYELLCDWLEELGAQLGLGPDRIVLGGFSQGAVMSYALGLGAGRPSPAAIIALSGFIPHTEGWEPDPAGREGLPAYVSHGARDPVIPVHLGRAALEVLERMGADVTYRETDAGHWIEPETVDELGRWIPDALASR